MDTRRQGDLGELSAATYFAGIGGLVALPFGHSPNWDLVVELRECLYRVQVKTCTCFRNGRWSVSICTRGGNQSWSGTSKLFDASRCDILFVHVGDGRRWMMPATAVEAGNKISLGGPKYAEWEVKAGEPLPDQARMDQAA